ncbi:MAG: recombinase family protein [Acidimicrobiales bacterium]|nr:recombinase family protein [Acidimicrobiales bacterium]
MSSSPSLACAAYVRTSTDDNQSPEDSKRWQLDIATRLVTPVGGTIVATYHDIDVTRERPWARRPEAARLLADAAHPGRGWSAVVIAEPQRAFSGGQFQLVFPQLTHYGIELWVPELGGRIDPDSEGHEMLMGLFGGLSKAERRRLQIRTRNAMLAHGAAGRWLGGRPNYGYRLVDTDQPHPQRQKATAGIKLRVLEPDRDTAPVVRRIFQLFDEGVGYRSIATILERDGLPSPGEVGPTRHPRSAGVWGGSAVRAILTNPRYLGHQVTGRQRRKDELLDPTDPAAGTTSRQRWQPAGEWVTSDEPAWPALVDADLWHRVNARITNTRGPQRRRPRAEPGKYLLAGMLCCAACGRSMHGATLKGKPYYRCNAQRPDYAETDGHPTTTAVREERILAALDPWLGQITDPGHRADTIAAVLDAEPESPAEPAQVQAARRAVRELPVELDRVLAAIRAGMDPELATRTTRQIQHDLAAAQATLAAWNADDHRPAPLTADDITAALEHAGDLAGLLAEAERETRARLYRTLDLVLNLDPVGDPPTLDVRLQLCGGGGRI